MKMDDVMADTGEARYYHRYKAHAVWWYIVQNEDDDALGSAKI